MKLNKEIVLHQSGLWNAMQKTVTETEASQEDIGLLNKLLCGKASDEEIRWRKKHLAAVLRWFVYEASTYLGALSYILYHQRRDYFEKNGPANIHQSLVVLWMGQGFYFFNHLEDVENKLEDLSLKFTVFII